MIDSDQFLDHLNTFLRGWGVRLEVSGYDFDFELTDDQGNVITRLWVDRGRIASTEELYSD